MDKVLLLIGRAASVVGVLLCVIAAVARLSGQFWIGSMQAGSVLQAGSAVMLLACVCFLAVLTRQGSRNE
jgi:hypothetical protein